MSDIIGIVGFLGSGKNTAGQVLIDKFGYKHDSFADPLKDVVSTIFGWPRAMLEGDTAESRAWRDQPDEWWENELDWINHPLNYMVRRFTPRLALQLFGTDVLRKNFHNDIWILSLRNRLRTADRVVITDCRFPNEIKTIKEMGGKVFRVRRGPEPEWWDLAIAANSDTFLHAPECAKELDKLGVHISEWAWVGQEFDAIIENEGTLEDLEAQVQCLVSSM